MNQDQLKETLDRLTDHTDYTVIFSGKMSKKIDGLYHPEKKEIIIHNKNFVEDNQAIYTGLHELSHHIDFTVNHETNTRNAHGKRWQKIFDDLVKEAISQGIYKDYDSEILDDAIRMNREHTAFLKRFGKALITLLDECQKKHHHFDDLVSRKLSLKNSQAKAIMCVYAMDIPEEAGGHFAERITKISDPEKRNEAVVSGKVPIVEPKTGNKNKDEMDRGMDEVSFLERERRNLERKIERMQERIEEIDLLVEGLTND